MKAICNKCRKTKPLNEFYKDNNRKSGITRWCKDCFKAYSQSEKGKEKNKKYAAKPEVKQYKRKWAQQKLETDPDYKQRQAESVKKYQQSEKGKRALRRNSRKMYKKYKIFWQAHKAVQNAIKRGDLSPVNTQICIDCGKQAEHYHHQSYNKRDWLKVIPLCIQCHKNRHNLSK